MLGVCLTLSLAAACSDEDDGGDEAATGDAPPDSALALAPPPLPTLAGEGEVREYQLLLVNRLEGRAHVFASAGAGRVVLDTVPGSDSVFVDIRVRADEVLLEAEDDAGHVVSSITLDLVRADINRWEITRMGRDLVTLSRPRSPLVASKPEE